MQTSSGSKIVMIYSTTDGHTVVICQKLKDILERQGHQLTIVAIDDVDKMNLLDFDKIVLGASIRYGKHSPKMIAFINQNASLLDSKKSAFFSVNVVARKPEKNLPHTNPYFIKFLTHITWKPKTTAVFAGRIDYAKCSFVDRHMIRLIMWITKGPTDLSQVYEFTDWNQVEAFGHTIDQM